MGFIQDQSLNHQVHVLLKARYPDITGVSILIQGTSPLSYSVNITFEDETKVYIPLGQSPALFRLLMGANYPESVIQDLINDLHNRVLNALLESILLGDTNEKD